MHAVDAIAKKKIRNIGDDELKRNMGKTSIEHREGNKEKKTEQRRHETSNKSQNGTCEPDRSNLRTEPQNTRGEN